MFNNKIRLLLGLVLLLGCTYTIARRVFLPVDNETVTLPILSSIPPFELVDQQAQPFTSANLKEGIWLVDFFFTTCPSICPMMTQKMLKIHRRYRKRVPFHTLSITVNPAYDSPARLKEYAESYRIENYDKWYFLTGEEKKIHRLAWEGFKVGSKTELADHSSYFILVDDQLQIRGYYDSNDQHVMKKLNREIEFLLAEVSKTETDKGS